nr:MULTISPECIES: TnsD family Tn7-like transposition protein [unclassified Herbaspirillum]
MGAPFVQYCSKHRLLLTAINSQLLLFDSRCERAATPTQIDHDVELGRRIYHCICITAEQSGYHKSHVVELLSAAGWFTETGRMHLAEFIQRFCNRFRGAFADARLDYLVQSEKYINDAIRSLLRADRGIHPIWCILFAWFTETEQRTISTSQKKMDRVTASPSRAEIAAQMEQHRTLTATSKAMDIDMAKLTGLCKSYQIPFSARPKKYDDALVASINEAYDKGLRPFEVVIKFRISQTMAYRILRWRSDGLNPESKVIALRTEDAKSQWLAALDKHPSITYTALRKLKTGVWMQLYRKAPEWLSCHRPQKSISARNARREPPKEILALFKSAIKDAASACGGRGKKPVHKSLYRIRELTGTHV